METLKRTLRLLPVQEITPWLDNPKRRLVQNRQYRELRDHIALNGQLDPIDVAPTDQHQYQIVRGHRRYQIIRHDLGWPFVETWVWFEPWEMVANRLIATERMQRAWHGGDKGEAVNALGVEQASELFRPEDALLLKWAAEQLADDSELFRWLCARFGPRVFAKTRCLVDNLWSLSRICAAIRKIGHYRCIEVTGMSIDNRRAILARAEESTLQDKTG